MVEKEYLFSCVNMGNTEFSNVVLESLPAKKRKLFKPDNIKTFTEFTNVAEKAYASITIDDFKKFRKLVIKGIQYSKGDKDKIRKNIEEGYPLNRDGCAMYFFYLLIASGLYKTVLDISYPKGAGNNEPFFILAMWKNVEKYAARLFPDGTYSKTLQGVMLNELSQMGRRASIKKQDAFIINKENVSLAFMKSSEFGGVAMTTPMQKVLSMYHEELCKVLPADLTELGKVTLDELGKYSRCRITLDNYMKLTQTKDKKTARKTIETACDRLYEISFVTTVKQGKDIKTYKGRLFQSQLTKQRGGIYEMEFSNDFLRYCATTTPAVFHPAMYLIDGNKYRYGWSIIQKLRMYYEINRGREQAARLSVSKLLEAVPDIPTYEEVMQGDKHTDRRIISPVEKTLDEWQRLGVLKSWEYSNAKGLPLTGKQTENMDYDTWSKLYIAFELNLPPQDQYIEQHQKRIAKAKERAAKIKTVSKKGGVVHR